MLGLMARLFQWNILRSRVQLAIMALAVLGSLSSYVLLGTALSEMSVQVMDAMRSEWPYDFEVQAWFDEDLEQQISSLPGLNHLEIVTMTDVFFYSESLRLLSVPSSKTALVMELQEGSMATTDDEIVIPGALALGYGIKVGDVLTVQSSKTVNRPVLYTVSGILSSKKGVLLHPICSFEGLTRLVAADKLTPSALLQLDGRTNLMSFQKSLENIGKGLAITAIAEEYDDAQANLTLSDSLVTGLRGLILIITALSLSVLLYMSQRSGSYQVGVLRAVGLPRPWLLLPAFMQTILIFAFGYLATYVSLPFIASAIGLESNRILLLQHLAGDIWVFLGVGLLSTLVVQLQFLSTSIPHLFKDAW